MEVHHTADGIAAVHHRTRPKKHFGAFQVIGIQGNDILQIAGPENGIFHAHPIDDQHLAVGRKSA